MSKLKAADVRRALAARFKQPEYAIFFEVNNGTGMNGGRRYADAIAMSLWPSRGLHLHGFEIKVSRSDWLSELKNPEKAELFASRCHTWSLVTANDIVKSGEVPAQWGWYEIVSGKVECRQPPPITEAANPEWHWIAAILRRAGEVCEGDIKAEADARIKKTEQRLHENYRADIQRVVDSRTRAAKAIIEQAAHFEKMTGIKLGGWGDEFKRFTAAAKALMELSGYNGDPVDKISNSIVNLERALTAMKAVHSEFVGEQKSLLPEDALP